MIELAVAASPRVSLSLALLPRTATAHPRVISATGKGRPTMKLPHNPPDPSTWGSS